MALREAPEIDGVDCPSGISDVSPMEIVTASLENGIRLHRSNRKVDYDVEVFSEGRFLRNRVALTEVVIGFAQREMGWSEASARRVYEKALKVDDSEDESLIPSVLLFRREGIIGGVSAQRLKDVRTYEVGTVPVLYHILRGFEPDFRNKRMGRDSIELARFTHREAEYYAARNSGPVPVWATMQAGKQEPTDISDIFVEGTFHPWDRFYDQDESDRVYQQIMAELHMDIRTNGRWISGTTAVSIADYPQYNESYLPKPGHVPTEELLKRMEGRRLRDGQLGMDIKRRDSVITVARFR